VLVLLLLVPAGALAAAPPAVDAARDLPFTWSTQTLAPGGKALEAWLTPRIARADPQQLFTDLRALYTTGLLPSLDTQLSLDVSIASNQSSSSADARVSSLWRWAPFKSDGPVGFGVLGRASLGVDAAELELRALIDKRLGRVLLAANGSVSRELFWSGRTGIDTRLEESAGARFAINETASFGLELRARSSFLLGAYQGTGFYVGPTLAFHFSRLWFSLGLEAQVGADKAPADRGNGEPLELRDNERVVGRLVVGRPVK
jgi:hypothetical protein